MTYNKVGTVENIGDALTNAMKTDTLRYHVENGCAECRRDRHCMAPAVFGDTSEQERCLEPKATEEGTIADDVGEFWRGTIEQH